MWQPNWLTKSQPASQPAGVQELWLPKGEAGATFWGRPGRPHRTGQVPGVCPPVWCAHRGGAAASLVGRGRGVGSTALPAASSGGRHQGPEPSMRVPCLPDPAPRDGGGGGKEQPSGSKFGDLALPSTSEVNVGGVSSTVWASVSLINKMMGDANLECLHQFGA